MVVGKMNEKKKENLLVQKNIVCFSDDFKT